MKLEAKKLLLDVIEACRDVKEFTQQSSLRHYLGSELLRSAVERKFEIIGEALVRLREKDPETFLKINAGKRAIGFRNRLVHGYDTINHETVWHTVQNDLSALKAEAEQLLGENP
jgi:uncharacterized protein with HEPN domain